MPSRERNSGLTPVYTWFVLMQLGQHQKEFMDVSTMKIRDLALHRANGATGDLQREAEALAMPLMNLYSALGRAELKSDLSPEQAKETVVRVLLDGDKTMTDLAAALDVCYLLPDAAGSA